MVLVNARAYWAAADLAEGCARPWPRAVIEQAMGIPSRRIARGGSGPYTRAVGGPELARPQLERRRLERAVVMRGNRWS